MKFEIVYVHKEVAHSYKGYVIVEAEDVEHAKAKVRNAHILGKLTFAMPLSRPLKPSESMTIEGVDTYRGFREAEL